MQAPFPLFGALNVPYRIIELLHTNRHRELLSEGSEVQILPETLTKRSKMLAELADSERFSYFLITFVSSEF